MKKFLWFVIPSLLLMLFSFTQLMSPVSMLEIFLVIIGSSVTGSIIGLVLFLLNKYLFKKNIV